MPDYQITRLPNHPITQSPNHPITQSPNRPITQPPNSHTRLRFGGRQPLCGIGVTSRIDFTSRPTVCSARMADSRPEPGPLTFTSTLRRPYVFAALPALIA